MSPTKNTPRKRTWHFRSPGTAVLLLLGVATLMTQFESGLSQQAPPGAVALTQVISSGTVVSTASVGASLWKVVLKEHKFVVYSAKDVALGTEIPFEILDLTDISGGTSSIALVINK